MRELLISHSFAPLPYWSEETALGFVRDQENRVAKSTLNVRARRLHSFFNYCIEQGILIKNPMNLRVVPKNRALTEPKTLSIEECHLMLRKIPKASFVGCRDRLAVALMMINGLRVSSVVSIDWEHLEKRSEGWVLKTYAKGGVIRNTILRPDVFQLFNNLHKKTFGVPLE